MVYFSIITVCLNNKAGLIQTIESISKQDFQEYESLVIDGASNDGTLEYLELLNNSKFKIYSEPDNGIYDAQNKGIRHSKGKFLIFLNSGDTFENSNVLQKIFQYSQENEDIIYGNIKLIDQDQKIIELVYPDNITYKYWYQSNYLCHQSIFFNKRLFEIYGNYNTSYKFAADFDFLQRIWFQKKLIKKHLNIFIVNYKLDGVSAKKENSILIKKEYHLIQWRNNPLLTFIFCYLYYSKLINLASKNKIINKLLQTIIFIKLIINSIIRIFIRMDKNFYKLYNFNNDSKPRILHLSSSDNSGGAAKAAYNIHSNLIKNGQNSLLFVLHKSKFDNTVILAQKKTGLNWLFSFFKYILNKNKFNNLTLKNDILHSLQTESFIDIQLIIEHFKPDVIHLHWIGGNFLSIEDLGKIKIPIVWTLHDMWPFLGAEHVSFDDSYKNGYQKDDNINYLVWQRKILAYKNLKIFPVGVSNWITSLAKESLLMSNFKSRVIPNIINTDIFFPRVVSEGKKLFNFDNNKKYILFGSDYKDVNKGYHLIVDLINLFDAEERVDIVFVIFGNNKITKKTKFINIINLGYIRDEDILAKLYSSVDVTIIMSKLESFCLIAAESISCGTPVISFDTSGLRDIIKNEKYGYLTSCYDLKEFKSNIEKIFLELNNKKISVENLHNFIIQNFSSDVVINNYISLYEEICK